MKKIILLTIVILSIFSCSKGNDSLPLKVNSAPIVSLKVPESFEFGKTYNLTVTYQLPSSCYFFYDLNYEYNGTERNLTVLIYEDKEAICPQVIVEAQQDFLVKVSQHDDYTFNIWKGKDSAGNDIIESIVVPVIN